MSETRKYRDISYILTRKQVKNVNLRIKSDGTVAVSAHKRVPIGFIEDFILSKEDFIKKAQIKRNIHTGEKEKEAFSSEECLKLFKAAVEEACEKMQDEGIAMPLIRVKRMKSMWGNCYAKRGLITLNSHLMSVPEDCMKYVIIHELCHFKQQNHSKDFWQIVEKYVPDYKLKRKTLKEWSGITK